MKSLLECGGHAFPTEGQLYQAGATLRDYFAAATLQGTLAGLRDVSALLEAGKVARAEGCSIHELVARAAFEVADAMLAERIK